MSDGVRLTIMQERFCQYYVSEGNASQAAVKAGYSEDTAKQMGYENLTKPYLKARIDQIEADALEASQLSPEWVLKMLKSNAIAGATEGETFNLGASNKAVELIGKHHSMFVDRKEIDIEGTVNLTHMTDEQLSAIAAGTD